MSATTFLTIAIVVALAGEIAAVVWAVRAANRAAPANDDIAGGGAGAPAGSGARPARVVVLAAYRSAVHRARGRSSWRLTRIERRLRATYQRGRLDASGHVGLAAVRFVLGERGRPLPPLGHRPALPDITDRSRR